MKRTLGALWIVFIAACVVCVACSIKSAPSSLEAFANPEPVQYDPIVPERWVTANGIEVLFYHDDELPLISGTVYMRGGDLWEPPGLAAAMGDQMRAGGAGDFSADQLDRRLEELAADVGSNVGGEFGTVSFSALSADTEKIFALFADVILRPRFEKSRLDLWKGQQIEGIRRRVEDPQTVASAAFGEILFQGTPYGTPVVEDDLNRITREEMIRTHGYLIRPDGAILTIVGSVEKNLIKQLIEKYLGGWTARGKPLPPPPGIQFEPKPGIYFVELPFEQSTILIGHQGLPRLTPDHIAIRGFNEIFGAGGFSSRLMQRIRVKSGLAYVTYASILPDVVKGKNVILLQTKSDSVGEAVKEAISVLQEMQAQPVTPVELSEMQRSIQNSFVFQFDSPSKVMTRQASLELLGYPADYDRTYLPKIEALKVGDVQTVARERWRLKDFVYVVVGDARAYASMKKLVAESGGPYSGLPIRKIGFDQKVVW